jgi:tripartite-type tricarboxylate transporter receptor subunit TctC
MCNVFAGPRSFVARHAIGLVLCLAASVYYVRPVGAEGYPDRTVKIIVPFPAGGTSDVVARIIANWLSRKWDQPIVIANHSGAAGNIGAQLAYRSAPDGYTLLSAPPAPLVVNQNLYPKLAFDPAGFEPVAIIGTVPLGLVVNPDKIKAANFQELVDYLRQNPGKANAATQGVGTTSHLTSELFQLMTKVKFRNIAYQGSAPALQALLAGEVEMMFETLGVSLSLVKAGKLKLIAVASAQRLPAFPEVPAIAEALPGFESAGWYAIVAPPRTPKTIVDRINADVNEALRQPEVIEHLKSFSIEVFGGSAERTAKYMHEEVDRWANVIRAAHIKLQ